MKKFKGFIAILLALIMALSMAGCSDLLYVAGAVAELAVEQAVNQQAQENSSKDDGADSESAIDSVTVTDAEELPLEEAGEEAEEAVEAAVEETVAQEAVPAIDEYGTYTSKDDVALYIHTYGKLPGNFMTKNEARSLGWEGGSLERYAPGYCIGGDRFGNYEGLLPTAKGRTYTECDIDTLNRSSRGAKRIVFSNDGLIYYTDDHYASFELLYGEE